jgi:hypothetical protein
MMHLPFLEGVDDHLSGQHGAASFRGAFGYPGVGRTRSHNK